MKDVMRHENSGWGRGKNRHKKGVARKFAAEIDAQSTATLSEVLVDEIDRADLFDPKEFGSHRGLHCDR